jgi:hypothetical protein
MAVPYNATGLWPTSDFGAAPKYARGASGEVFVTPEDTGILRHLAGRLAGLAARPEEEAKRELWRAHNALRSKRPVILADPENGWNEIITPSSIECTGEMARRWEMVLRKELYWGEHLQDDKPLEALFEIGPTFTDSEWGVTETFHGGVDGQSYSWEGSIQSPADVEKISTPRISVDTRTTLETLDVARHVFAGILRVDLRAVWWWSLGMSYDLARLVGLEKMLYLMYDDPGMVHAIMKRLRDGYLAKLDQLESDRLLSLNNNHAYVGSGGIGYTRELPTRETGDSGVKTRDLWGFTESQETIGVSPAQFEEFVFQYQLPIQERFGLNCYGCCEPLDPRWDVVKKTPRLRRVSVSPWADQKKMAALLEDRYVYSRKPSPTALAVPRMEEDPVREDLRSTLEITRGCVVELIMKDNHTLGKNPDNLVRWVRIAREEVEKAAR